MMSNAMMNSNPAGAIDFKTALFGVAFETAARQQAFGNTPDTGRLARDAVGLSAPQLRTAFSIYAPGYTPPETVPANREPMIKDALAASAGAFTPFCGIH